MTSHPQRETNVFIFRRSPWARDTRGINVLMHPSPNISTGSIKSLRFKKGGYLVILEVIISL